MGSIGKDSVVGYCVSFNAHTQAAPTDQLCLIGECDSPVVIVFEISLVICFVSVTIYCVCMASLL